MASLKAELAKMESSVNNLINRIAGTAKTISAGSGGKGTGSNFLDNSLAAFSSNPFERAYGRFGVGMSMVQSGGRMVQGATQMMPDVSATMERMTTYYNASLRASSGMSREQLQRTTMGSMRGGMTAPGSDAMVAGYLGMRGMMANTSFGSTYQETVRGVSSAAKYLNMSNERAVAAIEGLTSGQGAAGMLSRFGIFTADPTTGKEKTQGQIFQELYGRLSAGRGPATEEQVMTSFRRGALGATLRSSGMSEDQQQMFLQYALEKARGNNMDLSDPEAMDSLMKKAKAEGKENPNLPGYNLNTAKTDAMQNAQEQYLTGIKGATVVLEGLTQVGGMLAGTFGALTAAVGMLSGSITAMGAGNLAAGMGGMAAGGMVLGKTGKGKGKGAQTSGGGGGYLSGAKGRAGQGLKVGGPMAALTAAMALPGVISDVQAGQGGSAIGGMAGSIGGALAGAAIGQALIPIPVVGALVGSMVGGYLGGQGGSAIGSMFDQGEGGGNDGQGQGTMGMASGQNEPFWLQHPTKTAKIGARYGATHSIYSGKLVWPNGHKGIDYEGTEATTIHAAADGVATLESGGELGLRVKIQHSNGKYTFYCHLSRQSVKNGANVKRGDVIGYMGNTGGKSNGVHLHFALSKTSTTAGHEDPEPYLRGSANYMDPAPANQGQSATGNNPAPSGSSGTVEARGGEDTSASANTTSASGLMGSASDGDNVNAPGASGRSAAGGVEPYSAASHYGSGGAAPTGEGGENALTNESSGYLTAPEGLKSAKRRGSSGAGNTVTNNVTINLSIEKGTPEEARRFAHMLKQALEDEHSMKAMARN